MVVWDNTKKKIFFAESQGSLAPWFALFSKRDRGYCIQTNGFGPLWYLIEPCLPRLFYVIFNNLAGIFTERCLLLFNLAGITVWNYFTGFSGTSNTFAANGILGKYIFPGYYANLSLWFQICCGLESVIFMVFFILLLYQGADISFNE
jgi:hypothetical protein